MGKNREKAKAQTSSHISPPLFAQARAHHQSAFPSTFHPKSPSSKCSKPVNSKIRLQKTVARYHEK
jgi:hypothetical protein